MHILQESLNIFATESEDESLHFQGIFQTFNLHNNMKGSVDFMKRR